MLDVPGPLSLVCDLPTGTLVQLISGILEDTANLCSRDVRGTSTRFHSTQLLPISVQDYLDRCVKWLPVQKDALLLVLVYLRRVASQQSWPMHPKYLKHRRHTRPIFNRWTIHRLLLAALSIASKVSCHLNANDPISKDESAVHQ